MNLSFSVSNLPSQSASHINRRKSAWKMSWCDFRGTTWTPLLAALCLDPSLLAQFLNPRLAWEQRRVQDCVLTCLDRGGRGRTLPGADWCC